jgi:hypothetical protein
MLSPGIPRGDETATEEVTTKPEITIFSAPLHPFFFTFSVSIIFFCCFPDVENLLSSIFSHLI